MSRFLVAVRDMNNVAPTFEVEAADERQAQERARHAARFEGLRFPLAIVAVEAVEEAAA